MTTTTLMTNKYKITTHEGTSGFTVTAQRTGNDLAVLMEFDQATLEEGVAMVATVLTQLEELYGEGYVTACVAHYAQDTGKKFMEAGDHQIGVIRGYRRAGRRK